MAWSASPVFGTSEATFSSGNWTPASFDSTGSEQLFVAVRGSNISPAISDSQSNTWELVRTQSDSFGEPKVALFVARNCVGKTSASHTVTLTIPDGNRSYAVAGFTGGDTSDVIDQSTGGAAVFNTTISAGSLTAAGNGYLLLAVYGLDDFASVDNGYARAPGSGTENIVITYLVQSTAAGINPAGTSSSSSTYLMAIHASFIPGSGGGGPTGNPWYHHLQNS